MHSQPGTHANTPHPARPTELPQCSPVPLQWPGFPAGHPMCSSSGSTFMMTSGLASPESTERCWVGARGARGDTDGLHIPASSNGTAGLT